MDAFLHFLFLIKKEIIHHIAKLKKHNQYKQHIPGSAFLSLKTGLVNYMDP